jgi:hypothetical protein
MMSVVKVVRGTVSIALCLCLLALPACSPIKYEVELKCPPGGGADGTPPGPCLDRAATSNDVATDTGYQCAAGLPSKACKYVGQRNCNSTSPTHVCKNVNNGPNTACSCQCLAP